MVNYLIGSNMKKIICILVSVVFWNCGGGSGLNVTAQSNLSSNSSATHNTNNYPGFTESTEKPMDDDGFYNGFFDRHPEAVNYVSYDYDTELEDDVGNISVEKIQTTAYVNYNGTPSQVFALRDKYNTVNIHVAWDPTLNYADHEELKFFLCEIDNGDKYKPIEDVGYEPIYGLNCSIESNMCAVDQSEWINGEKNVTLEVNVGHFNKNVNVGLCMQYATYLPVLYDALEIKVYDTQTFDVTLAHVGTLENNLETGINDKIKETLERAGVKINFTSTVEYRVPDDFENISYRERELSRDYLYVAVASNGSESNCYANVYDDLYWLRSKIESDIGYRKIERRTAVILNKQTVKFWTINDRYLPCTQNLEEAPNKKASFGYVVGILNNEKYSECQWKYPYAKDVYYGYNSFDDKMGWYSIYGSESIDDDISSYIDPKCHVLVDIDRLGKVNGKDTKYYRTLMSSTALGVTTVARPVSNITGLMSFNPTDEQIFVHELTHLCGLSDVDKSEKNLMYKNNSGGTHLGNIPLEVFHITKDENGKENVDEGLEQQWDCLHNESSAEGCFDKPYRKLTME